MRKESGRRSVNGVYVYTNDPTRAWRSGTTARVRWASGDLSMWLSSATTTCVWVGLRIGDRSTHMHY